MTVPVEITFVSNAQRRFLMHNGNFVAIGANGKATIQSQLNVFEVLLFGIEGIAGNTATITLTPQAPHTLEISSHPIQGRIAAGKTVWGDSRFFRVK